MVMRAAGYGSEALTALAESIAAAKASDRFAPVTVVVPSNYAGLSARRTLGKHGLFNVRFMVLARLAELLGAPSLAAAGRRPLTPEIRAEAIRVALRRAPGVFASVASHPATQDSLARTFRDLREGGEGTIAALRTGGPRSSSVGAAYSEYLDAVAGYYDPADLAVSAAETVERNSAALRDIGRVILYLPERLNAGDSRFVRALQACGLVDLILGTTGDRAADGEAERLATGLGLSAPGNATATNVYADASIVVATDPEEEVRTALRTIAAEVAGGTPLHRMAMLYRSREPYASLTREQLTAAGVAHHGPRVLTLAESVAGRALMGLLRLRDQHFQRAAVMDWLTSAPVREHAGVHSSLVPAQRWDLISRAAGVTAGPAWSRLERHAHELDRRAAQVRAGLSEDEEPTRAERYERDSQQTRRLATFVAELQHALEPPAAGTHGAFGGWARGLLDRYLGASLWLERDGGVIDEEADALEQVREVLGELGSLGAALGHDAEKVTLEAFVQALRRSLEARGPRLGAFGDGVFVGPLALAAGMSFDLVFILGMVEGQLPPAGRDDPLLPDDERRRIDPGLPLRGTQRARERRSYLAALASAPRRVLMFPRADLRSQSQNLPARWLLEAATALESRRTGDAGSLGTEQFITLVEHAGASTASGDWLTAVPSFNAALKGYDAPASEQEYDLRQMGLAWPPADHYLARSIRSLGDGMAATHARASKLVTEWDGLLGADAGRAPSVDRPASPTGLEGWANCPFSYFLKSVLHVAETERPEETLDIEPAERGSLIHDVLQTFFAGGGEFGFAPAPPRTALDQPWTADEREQMRAIARRYFERTEARGKTGIPLLWAARKKTILRELDLFLDAEQRRRLEQGLFFEAAELTFGADDPGSSPALVVPTTSGRAVAFRGRIDRLDVSPDGGRVAVIDYKTGSAKRYEKLKEDWVLGGRALQLSVYGLAAEREHPGATVSAEYWFVSEREKFDRTGHEFEEADQARFHEVLDIAVRGVEQGTFPAHSGEFDDFRKTWDNCRFCPYDALCVRDRDRAWKRKRGFAGITEYVRMVGEAEAADGS